MQDSAQSVTIDEAIGANLRHLRHRQRLSLDKVAKALAWMDTEAWSLWKLRRWETGGHAFTIEDLYLFCGLYGVNLISLVRPHQTDPNAPDYEPPEHVRIGEAEIPVEQYVMDLFIDPAGRFTDRVRNIAARKMAGTDAGTWHLEVALNDVDETWGEKGELADLISANAAAQDFFTYLKGLEDLSYLIETAEDDAHWRTLVAEAQTLWAEAKQDAERNHDDGLNQEDT